MQKFLFYIYFWIFMVMFLITYFIMESAWSDYCWIVMKHSCEKRFIAPLWCCLTKTLSQCNSSFPHNIVKCTKKELKQNWRKMNTHRINSQLRQTSSQDKRNIEDIWYLSIWRNYRDLSFSIGAQKIINDVKSWKYTGKAFIITGQWKLALIHWNINIFEVLAFTINALNFPQFFIKKKKKNTHPHTHI